MKGDAPLLRGWAALLALALATTALIAATGGGGALVTLAALGLAGLKADVILGRYLALETVPAWRAGFRMAVVALLAALYGGFLLGG